MKRTVYKYELSVQDYVELDIEAGAQLLHVAQQSEKLVLWALVDPEARTVTRRFRVAGTGHAIDEPYVSYVGIALMYSGALVFHVFEVLRQPA